MFGRQRHYYIIAQNVYYLKKLIFDNEKLFPVSLWSYVFSSKKVTISHTRVSVIPPSARTNILRHLLKNSTFITSDRLCFLCLKNIMRRKHHSVNTEHSTSFPVFLGNNLVWNSIAGHVCWLIYLLSRPHMGSTKKLYSTCFSWVRTIIY